MENDNIIGLKFGRLTVLEKMPSIKSGKKSCSIYKCKCDCGNIINVRRTSLISKNTRSCGCLSKDTASITITKYNTKHNLHSHPLYNIWKSIKRRCNNPNEKKYKNYGGRGIRVCVEWENDFKLFYEWAINSGYKYEKLPNGMNKWTIDRIDNNGNYEPDNCRWITHKEQMRNVGYNRYYEINGEVITQAEICEKYNIKASTFYWRIKHGMTIKEAVETPIISKGNHNRNR